MAGADLRQKACTSSTPGCLAAGRIGEVPFERILAEEPPRFRPPGSEACRIAARDPGKQPFAHWGAFQDTVDEGNLGLLMALEFPCVKVFKYLT